MRSIQLDENLYGTLQRRASDEGFASVEELVTFVLTRGSAGDTLSLDYLFTPQHLADIEEAVVEIKAGNCRTAAEVREHFRRKLEAWKAANPARPRE